MKYRVTHHTAYAYSAPVVDCHSVARMLPRNTPWQTASRVRLEIAPEPVFQVEYEDFFGNRVVYFNVPEVHSTLSVSAYSLVEISPQPFRPDSASPPWESVQSWLARGANAELREASTYILPSTFVHPGQELTDYASASFLPGRPLIQATWDLICRIHDEFVYDPEFTTVATPVSEVLTNRRGVCQDFAHVAIGCLRALGLAARYVSGYLETLPPPGQARLVGADASHAWLAVYLPDAGWAQFDPTNALMPDERHVVVGWGRDYGDVAPLKGMMSGGGQHTLKVSVDVAPTPTGVR